MGKKGFREGRTQEELFKNSITKEEAERIRQQREFDKIVPGSLTYKMALFNDQLRQQLRRAKSVVEHRLWNVGNIQNTNDRLKQQLLSGHITEEIKPGVFMNENEINSLIQKNNWLLRGELFDIPRELADLRAVVGHIDITKKVIMTEEEFDDYVRWVQGELAKRGYELFV